MFYPARLRLVAAIAFSVYACAVAGVQGEPPKPTTVGELRALIKDLPAGTPVDFSQVTTSEHAAGDGASATATGDKLDQKLDSTAPAAHLSGGGGATGGDTQASQHAEVFEATWWRIGLGVLGLALWAGAGYKASRPVPEIDTALGLAAAGGACIAVAIWPALLWLLAIAVVCAVVSHFLPDKAKKVLADDVQAAEDKAAAIVKGIDVLRANVTHGPAVQKAMGDLKAQMKLAMGPQATAFVDSTKST